MSDRIAAITGDLTALVLTSQRSLTTVEDVHAGVVRILARHPEAITTPDRELVAAWCRVVTLPNLPELASDELRAKLETVRDDIRNILNICAREALENA